MQNDNRLAQCLNEILNGVRHDLMPPEEQGDEPNVQRNLMPALNEVADKKQPEPQAAQVCDEDSAQVG